MGALGVILVGFDFFRFCQFRACVGEVARGINLKTLNFAGGKLDDASKLPSESLSESVELSESLSSSESLDEYDKLSSSEILCDNGGARCIVNTFRLDELGGALFIIFIGGLLLDVDGR